VVGNLGWRTYTLVKPSDNYFIYTLPDVGNLPKSIALGVLGAPGIAAYFGFLDICRPIEEDTVVVSAAGGAVGSHVGQIAKIKGCRVIGITGSEEKARWLEFLGFDYVINYKTTKDLAADLRKGAPKGIDCYFDNVSFDSSGLLVLTGLSSGWRRHQQHRHAADEPRGPCVSLRGHFVLQRQSSSQG
jgi:prostaglandin reductase 1